MEQFGGLTYERSQLLGDAEILFLLNQYKPPKPEPEPGKPVSNVGKTVRADSRELFVHTQKLRGVTDPVEVERRWQICLQEREKLQAKQKAGGRVPNRQRGVGRQDTSSVRVVNPVGEGVTPHG